MKNSLILFFLSLSTFSLSSQNWEKVKGPYDYPYIQQTAIFNNELFCFTSLDESYKLEVNTWNKTKLNLPTNKSILFFKQKLNLIIFSSLDGTFISSDFGESWVKTPEFAKNGDEVGTVENTEIIKGKIFIIRSHSTNPKRRIFEYDFNINNWERIKVEGTDIDVVGTCFDSYENYIVSSSPYIFKRDSLESGTFYSSDFGTTWYKSEDLKHSFSTLKIHNNIVFGTGTDSLLYKSYDFGKSWEVDKSIKFAPNMYYSDGNNLFGIFGNPNNTSQFGIHISSDNGVTWKKRQGEFESFGVRGFFNFRNKIFCIDYYKKLFESTDYGKSWKHSEILTDSIITYDLYNNKDTLLAATSANRGIYTTDNQGIDWDLMGGEKNYRFERVIKIFKKDSIYVCINVTEASLNISTDYGLNWRNIYIGITEFNSNFIKGVEFLGNDTILVVTIFGARISSDFGETWSKFETEVLKSDFYITNSLRIDENTLLLNVRNEGLFKSKDNGQNWEKIDTDFLTELSTPFNNFSYFNGRIFIFLEFSTKRGLFYSEDEGKTWLEFNDDMSEKGRDRGILYYNGNTIISTDNGVIISNDEGKTSKSFVIEQIEKDTSIRTHITEIEISKDYLFVASTVGIYRIKLSDLGIEAITSVESEIERNYLYTLPPYPLPAKSEVKVLFYCDINLPMTVNDISIYDINGRKIETNGNLRLEKQASHKGNIVWDCSSAQSGVYIININHVTEEKSVKVIVE